MTKDDLVVTENNYEDNLFLFSSKKCPFDTPLFHLAIFCTYIKVSGVTGQYCIVTWLHNEKVLLKINLIYCGATIEGIIAYQCHMFIKGTAFISSERHTRHWFWLLVKLYTNKHFRKGGNSLWMSHICLFLRVNWFPPPSRVRGAKRKFGRMKNNGKINISREVGIWQKHFLP